MENIIHGVIFSHTYCIELLCSVEQSVLKAGGKNKNKTNVKNNSKKIKSK